MTDGEWLLVAGPKLDRAGGEETAAVDGILREVASLQGEVKPELYHLASDPGCEKDLISARSAEAVRLHGALVEFLQGHGVAESHLKYFRAS